MTGKGFHSWLPKAFLLGSYKQLFLSPPSVSAFVARIDLLRQVEEP